MAPTLSHQPTMQRSKSIHFKRMFEHPGRQSQSLILESGHDGHGSRPAGETPSDHRHIGWSLAENTKTEPISDMEMIKERFSKLLLGEDMSGGGKGVSSALALSNAITNLAEKKLEPMAEEKKRTWRKEMEWLLSVTDHIVEFVPSEQKSKDGTFMEIMVTRQRSDLLINVPVLRKLDAMLIECLDHFGNENEFWYEESDAETEQTDGNKGWLPTVRVPANGLSEVGRTWLQFQKNSLNQVLKTAMAINAQALTEMEIPESYIESLPKNGRASLGDLVYKSITDDYFDPAQLLSNLDLSTEQKILNLKNRIEASIVIWKRKMYQKDGKSSWGSSVSLEKRELFEERAETILLLLKQKFPGIPQSSLDTSKIQNNKDVGYSILESYSRVIENLAFSMLSGIEDVLDPSAETSSKMVFMEDDMEKLSTTITLSDFMGWKSDAKNNSPEKWFREGNDKFLSKSLTVKKVSYLEKLESLSGLRSPISRH